VAGQARCDAWGYSCRVGRASSKLASWVPGPCLLTLPQDLHPVPRPVKPLAGAQLPGACSVPARSITYSALDLHIIALWRLQQTPLDSRQPGVQ